jgi:lysophospholipase L1-like esterase
MAPLTGRRKWAARLILLFLSVAVVLVGFELVLRLQDRGEAAPSFRTLFMTDERIGYRLRPGASARLATVEFETDIHINEAGVRDDEIRPKPAHERRVLVLGDSMVMAVQVPFEQTFGQLLQHRLNQVRPGPERIRVINAGVQGYGPVEQYLFFHHVAADFEPDVVLVVTFVGNDAVEAAASATRLDGRPSTVVEDEGRFPPWLRRLARRSAAVQFVRIRLFAELGRTGHAPLRERPVDSYLVDPPADVMRGFDVARDAIERIVDRAAEGGARTAVILLPARFQLDPRDFADLTAEVKPFGMTLVRDGATERFRSAYANLPVPVLDLLPVFRGMPQADELFFRRNVHLTPRGHQVVAEELARFIRHQRLLESPLPVATGG